MKIRLPNTDITATVQKASNSRNDYEAIGDGRRVGRGTRQQAIIAARLWISGQAFAAAAKEAETARRRPNHRSQDNDTTDV